MGNVDRLAFPYSDDFRRAKRNSLIWSAVTIAAYLGSAPTREGTSATGLLGLSLSFTQDQLIFFAGSVSIFMTLGFLQAHRRLRLHASQLFAGTTDVEQVFRSLSSAASAEEVRLTAVQRNLGEAMTKWS